MTAAADVSALRRTPHEPEADYQLHHVRVTAVRALSPSFVRVTFCGPDLDRVSRPGLDQRIKLVLPAGERGLVQLPMTVDWYAAWRELPEEDRNPIRTYTIRDLRPEDRELDIDVVRHGATGPAGRWIEQVAVGDEVLVCAPNREAEEDPGGYDFAPPDSWDRLLLAGDETAVPALASILEALPEGAQATVVVEVPDAGDRAALPDRPDLDVRVVPRGDSGRGEAFEREVRAAATTVLADTPTQDDQPLPDVDVDVDLLWESVLGEDRREAAEVYAWLAGEAAVIKRLRRHLVADLGLDRRCVAFMGYWREGRTEDD